MRTFDASYWDDNFKPKKPSVSLPKKENNEKMKESAELHAWEMRQKPSYLEKMMIGFLKAHNIIDYEFQKIFYIAGKNQYITQYYIADFYFPSKKLILEVDGKFHNKQIKQDNRRTQILKQYYRKIKVIRFTYSDFSNEKKMMELLQKLNIYEYQKMKQNKS